MKPRHTPAGNAYRNDAVYRSAEILISLADRPSAKRGRFRQPLLFVAALALGLFIGFQLWYSPRTPTGAPATAENDSTRFPALARPPGAAATRTPALVPPASAPSDDDTAQALPSPDAAGLRVSPKTPDTARSPALARPAPSGTTAILQTTTILSTTDLYLHGELRSSSEPSQMVMFRLRQSQNNSPDPITGVIRFLKENRPFAGNAVAGAQDGLTLTLRETGPVWVNGDIDIVPVGRRFVIAIPLNITTGEFTGTWSLRDTHGTIHLKAATVR